MKHAGVIYVRVSYERRGDIKQHTIIKKAGIV